MLRLPLFASSKLGSSVPPPTPTSLSRRIGSAEPAGSILITSAPKLARMLPLAGVIIQLASSTTLIPARGPCSLMCVPPPALRYVYTAGVAPRTSSGNRARTRR